MAEDVTDMTVSLEFNGTQVATNPSRYNASVNTGSVVSVTFSDGARIAITNFDDKEAQDPVYGVPAASSGVEIANLYMYGMNMLDSGATFRVYDYSSGSLGTLLYTFSSDWDSDATIQFRYDTSGKTISILTSSDAHYPATDGSITGFSGSQVMSGPVCFLRGTRILTDRGEIAVEALRAGDRVATRFGGLQAVKWIGTQCFEGRFAGRGGTPVCIKAGAIGPNRPHSDLWVSPGHAVLVGELLVHAGALVNGATITQPPCAGEIAYFHLELAAHDCVLAEGMWAESYFEDHNRDDFHNAASFHAAFPGQAARREATCLPIVTADDPRVPAMRAALVPPAVAEPQAADADIHFVIDGRRVEAASHGNAAWQVQVPAGASELRLRSLATRPSVAGGSGDDWALGVLLWSIEAAGEDETRIIPVDHPGLGVGLHAVERRDGQTWRWTDGDAAIPVGLLGVTAAPVSVTVRGYHPKLDRGAAVRDAA